MGIADLKTRMRDVPGIEGLTMQVQAGKMIFNLNGRDLPPLDVTASDVQVEEAIRNAIATQASQALGNYGDSALN